jgi:hypothetical protein
MNRNQKAGISVVLILSGIIGLEMGGLFAVTASIFAIGVGVLGAKNALFD